MRVDNTTEAFANLIFENRSFQHREAFIVQAVVRLLGSIRYPSEQVFRFNNRATKVNPLTDAEIRVGSFESGRETPHLCRTDRQGGRKRVLRRLGWGARNAAKDFKRLLTSKILGRSRDILGILWHSYANPPINGGGSLNFLVVKFAISVKMIYWL